MKKLYQKANKDKYYNTLSYDDKENFISYFNQYNLILKSKPKSILEIGVGTKLLSTYLKNRGFEINTCDFDKNLNPDIVGDIRKLPIESNKYDTVVAFEVLEHLPFKEFKKSLNELKRVSKKTIIISIPYNTLNFAIHLKMIPFLKPIKFLFRICELRFIKHKFDGQHYWELGKKNYSKKKIKKIFEELKLDLKLEYSDPLNTYHHFFYLEKKQLIKK